MAVYEHTYKPYLGEMTPAWSRFLIIPRHAFRSVFGSKLFIGFFCVCFLPILVAAIMIYLHHNPEALAIFSLATKDLLTINATFFQVFLGIQGWFAFFLVLLVGPPLVARDVANNALPLYLCRPFSRAEYVLGKMSVVIILLSAITWVPLLLLFLFQSYLEGGGWMVHNLSIAGAIYFGSSVWIVFLALLSQTISAWVKWRMAASAALIAVFLIPSVIAEMINQLFRTRMGDLLSLGALNRAVWAGLFGEFTRDVNQFGGFQDGRPVLVVLQEPPLWASWVVLILLSLFCLWLLSRKVRAYEVIK
jgi:ABC-type transport system involved in multi-copper enzyme maturation permease subunit